ncbi:hypothetical protein Taro_002037 [Colocasia esculenta]|uniref:Protein FAR1-RELATED SEQUENCE n=1 Tax=Colocasia esculenta TaxID=4460 RepID=A0A843TKJ1_COLES|nr:hypothetical protein [Colocasia esculenta]
MQNEWLKSLYECRRKWAPIFLKDTFFAARLLLTTIVYRFLLYLLYLHCFVFVGMSTSQRSESINNFFDGFVTAKTILSEFIVKYIVELESRFDAKNQADLKSMDTEAYLKTCSPFEKQAATIYTRERTEGEREQEGKWEQKGYLRRRAEAGSPKAPTPPE